MSIFDIFKRNKDIQTRAVDIDVDPDNGYSVPLALDYYRPYGTFSSQTLSAVFCGVELISNSVAQLPIKIKNSEGTIISHPLEKIFTNNLVPKFNLIKNLVVDMILQGNGIAYIQRSNGQPSGLIYCPKSTYTINYDINTRRLTYSIPSISSKLIMPKDVIHIVKNSNDGIIGKPLNYFASRTLATANAAENESQNYFNSGCGLSGILKSQKHLSKKQQEEIRTSWNMSQTGNGASLAVLPVDLDYIPLGANASDSQLLESRLFSVQEIARYLCISPTLLMDLSHSNYNTLEAAQLDFLTHTLQPYIEILQDEFNRKLVANEDISIDFEEIYLLKSDKDSLSTYLGNLVSRGIMTINEARKELSLPEIEGGDKLIIPYTNINNNTIGNNNDNQQVINEDKTDDK